MVYAGPAPSAIGIYPALYQYLILLGIGLGNLSTYLLMKKYNGVNNTEQMIVGLVSIAAIPVATGLIQPYSLQDMTLL